MLTTDCGSLSCWRRTVRKLGSMLDGKTPCKKSYDWLEDMKKKDERKKMEELHQQRVSKSDD